MFNVRHRATHKEESSKESFATALFDIVQQQEKALKELQIDHELAVFKQRLFSGTDSLLMTRAAEIRNRGTGDAEGDEWFHDNVAVDELKSKLRRRRKRQVEYCMAHRRLVESRSRGVLKALQEETLQWTSATAETFHSLSREYPADPRVIKRLGEVYWLSLALCRVSAMIDAAEASSDTLALVEEAHRRLEESLRQLQSEHELEEERFSRLKAHEEAKRKLAAQHEARMAVADDDAKERLLQDLLLKLSLEKAEHINTFAEAFWKRRGGRWCEGRPKDLDELYKAELQEQLLVEVQALQLSEEEQYAQLKKEAETAAEKQVVLLEERMLGQQQQLIKEMEEKRQVYDKWLSRVRHRKEAEEHRRALQATHAQLQQQGRQWQEDGLKNLMSQYDTDRQQLEAALVVEAERQHKCAQRKKLSRNVERGKRLQQKRLIEKERFLAYQSEIRRREAALLKAPHVRKIFDGIQKISKLVALVQAAAASDAAVDEDEVASKKKPASKSSSSSSSSEDSSDSGTQSGTEDGASSSSSDLPALSDSSSQSMKSSGSDASPVGSKASDSEASDSDSSEDPETSGSDSDSSDSD
ncbi:hypothetical protein Emag_000011 [Eimeria magna]